MTLTAAYGASGAVTGYGAATEIGAPANPYWRYVGPRSNPNSPWMTRGPSPPYGTEYGRAKHALQRRESRLRPLPEQPLVREDSNSRRYSDWGWERTGDCPISQAKRTLHFVALLDELTRSLTRMAQVLPREALPVVQAAGARDASGDVHS